tara:strand:- start:1109 stop:2239 length:1131 start_codon:yes stop_codon:yes gene_type:complete
MEKYKNSIPYMKHQINDHDIDLVVKTLKSDYITQGPMVLKVEEEMSKLTNKAFGVMCSNGTAALHLVAEMLNQKSNILNKNIITTPFTFVADANFGRYINAEIRFADIDQETWTISPRSIENLIDENTVAVVAPHYAGLMCEIDEIKKICNENDIFLVEDACHAPTAKIDNKVSGSFGDVSTFSFHATKHIGAGEGGVICTDSETEYEDLQVLRSHGLPHWSKRTGYGYDIDKVAFNYRPNELAASIAVSHLNRIENLIDTRVKIAEYYNNQLDWNFYSKQNIPNHYTHVYHLYPIVVPESKLRETCLNFLKEANIFGQIHYPPINKMKGFKKYKSNTPVSDDISSRVISIPMFVQLTEDEKSFVVEKLNSFAKTI